MKILSIIGKIGSNLFNNIKNIFTCKKVKTIEATVKINRKPRGRRSGSVNKKAKK
jgi:hypothetical protein